MNESNSSIHVACHMRDDIDPDAVARVGATMFTSIVAAMEAGQGGYITVLRNCKIDVPITIFTAGTTLDLNGHTIVFVAPKSGDSKESDLPSLCITAPGTCIKDGRLSVLSGADNAVLLDRVAHKPEVMFYNVGLAYEGLGHALCVMSGIALLQNSRIESSASGIQVCSDRAHVGISSTRIVAQHKAITLNNGRLFSDSSHIAARDSNAILVEGGFLGICSSEVGSHHASAIRMTLSADVYAPPSIKICECTDVTSVRSHGLLIEGGNVTILRSMVRSFGSSAIRMGAQDSFGPLRLSVIGGSVISSWTDTAIERLSGILYLNNSSVKTINGSEVHELDSSEVEDDYSLDLAEPSFL
ncbi:MAG: hypothetical protein Q4A07_02325 [Coriobacteriales bacterium]|nr:hypothetical protein [Coriobacteriales bacterium]